MAKKVIVTGVTETTVQGTVVHDEFETVLYTGNGSTQTVPMANITGGVDFVWAKNRDISSHNGIFDSIRGLPIRLMTNLTNGEETDADGITSFGTTSFEVGAGADYNGNGNNIVAWCASLPNHNPSNTDGTITSETKSNSFMSAVSYVGTGANATVGHGLSTSPELMIFKDRDATDKWVANYVPSGIDNGLYLSDTTAEGSGFGGYWNNTAPTDSVIHLGSLSGLNAKTNTLNDSMIAYCFTSIAGKCKVGSYTGTRNSQSVDVGFEPSWVMIKRTDSVGQWVITDDKRGLKDLLADSPEAEDSFDAIELTSTGFRINSPWNYTDASGGTYIYIAIAKDTLQDTQQYDLTFAEQASAPTGVALPSKEVLVSTTETYNPTDNDFDVVGTATKSGRAMKLNLVAEEEDTTITTNPVVNLNKEP
jgi:hypothetical protein